MEPLLIGAGKTDIALFDGFDICFPTYIIRCLIFPPFLLFSLGCHTRMPLKIKKAIKVDRRKIYGLHGFALLGSVLLIVYSLSTSSRYRFDGNL
jgi:hypothetical protein